MKMLSPKDLVDLPWRWVGPVERSDEHGNNWWQLTITDLPDFLLAGDSKESVMADAPIALESFLDSFVDRPEWPVLPTGMVLVKDDAPATAARRAIVAAAVASGLAIVPNDRWSLTVAQ